MTSQKRVRFFAEQEYEIWNFHIKPILAGTVHHFEMDKFAIIVRLPKRPHPSSMSKYDEYAPITCNSWKNLSNRMLPIEFNVYRIMIEVDGGGECSIPADSIGKVNVSLFSKFKRNQLDAQANRLKETADKAFDYWLSILRWRSGNPYIRPPFGRNESLNFGTYLLDNNTHKRFYSPGHSFTVHSTSPITR